MTDVNNEVSSTLVSSLATDLAPILTNGALENMNLPIVSSLATGANNKVTLTLTLASSLVTDVAPILTNSALENMDITLISSLVTNSTDKVTSTLVSSFVTDVAPILANSTLENMDMTLVFSLVTNALANSGLSTPSLFPFSHISLPIAYNCVIGCSIQVISFHSILYLRVLTNQLPPNIL